MAAKAHDPLSDEDIKTIIQLSKAGFTVEQIAERFRTEPWEIKVIVNLKI